MLSQGAVPARPNGHALSETQAGKQTVELELYRSHGIAQGPAKDGAEGSARGGQACQCAAPEVNVVRDHDAEDGHGTRSRSHGALA